MPFGAFPFPLPEVCPVAPCDAPRLARIRHGRFAHRSEKPIFPAWNAIGVLDSMSRRLRRDVPSLAPSGLCGASGPFQARGRKCPEWPQVASLLARALSDPAKVLAELVGDALFSCDQRRGRVIAVAV